MAAKVFAAPHFTAPAATPAWTNFLGGFNIDGLPAQPGDEIAFFDPDGVLCGLYVVPSGLPGQYGTVAVYGDDDTTSAFDEGAVAGDVLALKVWDASAQREYINAELSLSASALDGIPASALPPVWQDQADHVLNVDTIQPHFADPVAQPLSSTYLGALTLFGLPAEAGDEVAVYDPDGVLVGHALVTTAGQYGAVEVYGDDPDTTADEGAVEGDVLSFAVWDRSGATEYSGGGVLLSAGDPLGFAVASSIPPVWSADTGHVLDLALGATSDVDGNGTVDVATDGVLFLRYLFGFRGEALIADAVAPDAVRTTATEIEALLAPLAGSGFDIDGNGTADGLTDGLLLVRYLSGQYSGSLLTAGAVGAGATRATETEIGAYIQELFPGP